MSWNLAFLAVLASIIVYSSIDAWFGPSGGQNIGPLQAEIRKLNNDIVELESRRARLEERTRGLIGPTIDRELLDERLRAVYGVAHPDDVLLVPPEE